MVDTHISNVKMAYLALATPFAFCFDLISGEKKRSKSLRKNYAGIGYTYDESRDAFIPPKPYSKWILNEDTCNWEAPVAYPEGDNPYIWNDNKGEWEEIVPA